MVEQNWYAVLGLTATASSTDIKRAFRKLAHIYHPDKHNNPVYFEQFKQIQKAYEILGNTDSKQLYDNSLQLQTKYYGAQKNINDINDLVTYFHKVERELQLADCRFINYDRIQWQLNSVLFLPSIAAMIQSAQLFEQQKILRKILYILSFLPYNHFKQYECKLTECFADHQHTLVIRQLISDKKQEALLNKFMIPLVAILSTLLCFAIYYLSK